MALHGCGTLFPMDSMKTDRWLRALALLLFLALLLVGLLTFKDYGISIDERIERENSMLSLKYLLTKLPFLNPFDESETASIQLEFSTFADRYYGHLLQWPASLVELLRGRKTDSRNIFLLRHLLNFLYYYFAVICFYRMLELRFRNRLIPLAGLIFLILSPRYYGEAFYNNKDMLFCCCFIVALYCLMRVVRHPTIGACVLLGLSTAVAANVRIVGLFVLAAAGSWFLCQFLSRRISFKTFLLRALSVCGSGLFFWLLFIPAAWGNPLIFIRDSLKFYSHFYHTAPVFFMGKTYQSNALPWDYIPVWMAVSIPVLYLLLFGVGLSFNVRALARHSGTWEDRCLDTIMTGLFFLPILLIIVLHSTMYSAWRHTYFLYVPLLWIALCGFSALLALRGKLLTLALCVASLVSCLFVGGWMISAHPYESVYFNALFRPLAQQNFEVDPMYLSTTEALNFILRNDDRERIMIWDDVKAIDLALDIIPAAQRRRITMQYYGYGGRPGDYIVFSHTYTVGKEVHYPFFESAYEVKAGGLILATVYQRSHRDDLWGYDVIQAAETSVASAETSAIWDGDFDSAWSAPLSDQPVSIEIAFRQPVTLSGLTFFTGDEARGFPRNLTVSSSENGRDWEIVPILFNGFSDYELTPLRARFLRLTNTESEAERPWTISELLFHGTSE